MYFWFITAVSIFCANKNQNLFWFFCLIYALYSLGTIPPHLLPRTDMHPSPLPSPPDISCDADDEAVSHGDEPAAFEPLHLELSDEAEEEQEKEGVDCTPLQAKEQDMKIAMALLEHRQQKYASVSRILDEVDCCGRIKGSSVLHQFQADPFYAQFTRMSRFDLVQSLRQLLQEKTQARVDFYASKAMYRLAWKKERLALLARRGEDAACEPERKRARV